MSAARRDSPIQSATPEDRELSGSSRVAVLLCTFNGGRFLGQQLDTLLAQSCQDFTLWVSDDGSSDDTINIVQSFTEKFGPSRTCLLRGPGRGCVANFLTLAANPAIRTQYYAFCDQDDLWAGDKLQRALAALQAIPGDQPKLYCARTWLIDEQENELGMSPLFSRSPGFANALLQNIGGGNTMVMNAAARALLVEAGPVDVVSHDWWTYMLVSGAGGRVIYDPRPVLKYRQHESNLIGSNTGWHNRLRRYLRVLDNRSRQWNDRNLQALRQVRHLLTPENQQVLDEFSCARQRSLLARLRGIRRAGVYLQTPGANLGLWVATLLNKV